MAIDLSPLIDQQGVFSISVYSTAPTADSPDSREKFRLSLPSNELMPAETKAQTATVAAAAVATNDTNGKGQGQQLIGPRKIEAKLWQIFRTSVQVNPVSDPTSTRAPTAAAARAADTTVLGAAEATNDSD